MALIAICIRIGVAKREVRTQTRVCLRSPHVEGSNLMQMAITRRPMPPATDLEALANPF